MITKEIKSIPATSVEITRILCDDCGAKAYNKCEVCKADLCTTHRHYYPDDNTGDYTLWICDSCLEVFKEFAPTIAEYELALENAIEERTYACTKSRKNFKMKKDETNKT